MEDLVPICTNWPQQWVENLQISHPVLIGEPLLDATLVGEPLLDAYIVINSSTTT